MVTGNHRKTILEVLDQLPPLHHVAQKLIAMMNDDGSSARDLDQLICNDQALTARILKMANSSAYGKSRDIFKLAEAVVLLGHTTIGNMVMGVSVADVVATDQNPEFIARAWEHSLDCAALSQTLAELTDYPEPGNAFVAGLLHDIGLLVQNQAVPEILGAVIADQPTDPLAAERAAMGINHAQVGMKLLDLWNLPLALCEAIRFHHAPDKKFKRANPLVNIVALADQLTAISGTTPYPRQEGVDIFRLLRDLGLKTVQFDKMFTVLKRSRDNARCLLDEAVGSEQSPKPAPSEVRDIAPVAVYATDERRQAWYSSVLNYLGVPVTDWQSCQGTTEAGAAPFRIVVDFHGAAPEERQDLTQFIRHNALSPIVLGEQRHTPQDPQWQSVPHMPTFFTRNEILDILEAPEPLPS